MGRKPQEQLSALAPLPPLATGATAPVDELTRILNLPRRPPVDCEKDPVIDQYQPATQALIEFVTAQFTRGLRVTCACRPRTVTRLTPDLVSIIRTLPPKLPPEPPKIVSISALVEDSRTHADEAATAQRITSLAVGATLELPALDNGVGRPCIITFNPQQAWTLHEGKIVGGIVGFKGVGSGKTISGLMVPLLFPDARQAVLCFESKQRQHYREHYLRMREHMRVSSIVFDDGGPGYIVPGTVPLHLVSYSRLSRTENSDLLDELNPNVLILDEAHRACGNSAINRRVKRFVYKKILQREEAMQRGERVLARALHLFDWSGTMEHDSVQNTQMLCAYSLGIGSPLPLDPDVAVAMSAVMDVSRRPDRESAFAQRLHAAFGDGPIDRQSDVDMIAAAMMDKEPERAVRKGFQKRRAETPGVITASSSACKASIYFTERKMPKMPDVVREALRAVRIDSLRPDGDTIADRLEQVSTAREVACGFYTYWAFPKLKCECTGDVRCAGCRHIDEWFRRRKAYNKELRAKLLIGEVKLDSEDLCEEAAKRYWNGYEGKLPVWACESWPAWAEIENTVEYDERVKWLGHGTPEAADPNTHPGYYLARDAAQWARDNKGVVWFKSRAFGRKVAELSGLPYFNGGPGCEARLSAEKGDRSIICSIKALGAGTDGLQYKFWKQLITEMPASNGGNEGMEQILGRLHREGQPADAIETEAYLGVTEFMDAFNKVLMQAEFHQDMQKLKQRILMADRSFL